MSSPPREHPWFRPCLAWLALISRIVPRAHRTAWRREWTGEVVHALRGEPGTAGARRRILRRVWLALPDAMRCRLDYRHPAADTVRPESHQNGDAMLTRVLRDARFALRFLRNDLGTTAIAVATIGLGIGASTAIFSLVDGILLKPLAYPQPDRVVVVWPDHWYSASLFELLEREAMSYDAIAAWGFRSFTARNDEGVERLWGTRASPAFLRVLGTPAARGRVFDARDGDQGGVGGVVLSFDTWQTRFGGAPDVVGQSLRLANGEMGERTIPIVGIMPEAFGFQPGDMAELSERADFALTVPFDRTATRYRSSEYRVVARLNPGITTAQAEEELRGLTGAWRERFGLTDDFGADISIVSLKEYITDPVRPTVMLLFGAVVLILVIALTNVTNLLLAKSVTRQREIAVRRALGATRQRVVGQVLTESAVLGAMGSVIGVAVAGAGVVGLRALLPAGTARLNEVTVDARVLGFCIATALIAGALAGVLPALRSARTDARAAMVREARGSTSGRGRRRALRGLLAMQIGVAVLLLFAAGLLAKSFLRLNRVDPGFQAEGLARVNVRPAAGRIGTMEADEQFFRLVDEAIEALPGVTAAAAITQAPVSGDGGVVGYHAEARPPAPGTTAPRARWRATSADYFSVASIPVLEGRVFTRSDGAGAEPVAVLSQQAARELFPDESPIGRRVVTGFESGVPVTVIGIVGDIRLLGPAEAPVPMVYRPFPQIRSVVERFGFASRDIVVRTEERPGDHFALIRTAVRDLDAYALTTGYEPLREAIGDTLADRRVTLVLLLCFAGAALVLGGIGIFGVTGYIVRDRRRELGVRIAVGATGPRVIRLVLAGVTRVCVVGVMLGAAASMAMASVLGGYLVEMVPFDPGILLLVIGTTVMVALLAGVVPARLAGRTDPIGVLNE